MALKDHYFTVAEVADQFNVTRQTIYRWIKKGILNTEQIGRETVIEKSEVIRYKEDTLNNWLTEGFNRRLESQNFKLLRDHFQLGDKDKIERMGDKTVPDYVVYSENQEPRVITIWGLGFSFNTKSGQIETDIKPEDIKIESMSSFEKNVKREERRMKKNKRE